MIRAIAVSSEELRMCSHYAFCLTCLPQLWHSSTANVITAFFPVIEEGKQQSPENRAFTSSARDFFAHFGRKTTVSAVINTCIQKEANFTLSSDVMGSISAGHCFWYPPTWAITGTDNRCRIVQLNSSNKLLLQTVSWNMTSWWPPSLCKCRSTAQQRKKNIQLLISDQIKTLMNWRFWWRSWASPGCVCGNSNTYPFQKNCPCYLKQGTYLHQSSGLKLAGRERLVLTVCPQCIQKGSTDNNHHSVFLPFSRSWKHWGGISLLMGDFNLHMNLHDLWGWSWTL